jgi:hypothetical protein
LVCEVVYEFAVFAIFACEGVTELKHGSAMCQCYRCRIRKRDSYVSIVTPPWRLRV